MKKKSRSILIKNVEIEKVNIKTVWEPSCVQLVSLDFSDPDGTLSDRYDEEDIPGGLVVKPHFIIPYFKGEYGIEGARRIGSSLLALSWLVNDFMYLNAVGKPVRVKVCPENCISAIGHITMDRWISEEEGLPEKFR